MVYTGIARSWYYTTVEEGENILMCFPRDICILGNHLFFNCMGKVSFQAKELYEFLAKINDSDYKLKVDNISIGNLGEDEWFFMLGITNNEVATLFKLTFC
jgi:hypothetical protein